MALKSLQILKERNFAYLWWTTLVSDAGTWMQSVAIAALITDLTQQALWGALAGAAAFITSGLVVPFGGVIADNHDRRKMLLLISVLNAFVAAVLALLYIADLISPWLLVGTVGAEGVLFALAFPARIAMFPDLVGTERVVDASALVAVSWNFGRVLGPIVAGIFVAADLYEWIFVINAVSFLAVTVATLLMKMPPRERQSSAPVIGRIKEGFVGARAESGCWAAITMLAIVALTISPFIALVPAMAQLVLEGTPVETTRAVMAQGLGTVAFTLFLPSLISRFTHRQVLLITGTLLPIAGLAFACSTSFLMAYIVLALYGGIYFCFYLALSTIVQTRAPEALRARIISIFSTTLNLLYPVGALTQGWLGDHFGIRKVLAFGSMSFALIWVALLIGRSGLIKTLVHALEIPHVKSAEGVLSSGPGVEEPSP